jgi:hypothetical protein
MWRVTPTPLPDDIRAYIRLNRLDTEPVWCYSGVMKITPTERNTVSAFVLSSAVSVPASGAGALAGFECKCSCGMVLRSSLRTILEADVAAHAAYHTRKAA